jgi:hypothetical protein
MYSATQYSELVATMTEAEARRIVDLSSKDRQVTMTEAEKAAFPATFVKAEHRLHRLSEMTEADALLRITAPLCRGCLRPSCICNQSRELFKRFYGASWCSCCGQDYTKDLDNTLFSSGSYEVVTDGKRRRKEDGVLYEKVGRLWVRIPCASCAPAYVEARARAIEGVLEEEEFERREAISWTHERRC